MKKEKLTEEVLNIGYYILGSLIYGVALKLFITPNEISPGGVTGVSTVLNYCFSLPIGLCVFIINIPILFIGFRAFGKKFILKTAIATAVFSATIDILDVFIKPLQIDKILAALFGGILMGVGLSIIMRRGATTGGVEIIAKLLNKNRQHISIGRFILFTDAFIVALSVLVYRNLQSALYSVVTLFVASVVTDIMLYGGDKAKIVYIITEHHSEITKSLLEIKRGVTLIDAVGGYSGLPKKMIICTVRKYEVSAVYKAVKEMDREAFIILSDAIEVIGEGFKKE